MDIGRHRRGGIGLAEQVDGDLSLGEEFVPEVQREVFSHTHKDVEEMRLEIPDCDFGHVSAMDQTSSYVTLYVSAMRDFIAVEISLSRTCLRGKTPARCKQLMRDK